MTIPRRHHTHTLKDKIDDKFIRQTRKSLEIQGFLPSERKKYGLKAARRAPQFSKR